ncbi:MAG: SCO family protein [Verrucomicrobiales bacterium]|nr:SCO family protein [Verrucomicrobiales bacterium]
MIGKSSADPSTGPSAPVATPTGPTLAKRFLLLLAAVTTILVVIAVLAPRRPPIPTPSFDDSPRTSKLPSLPRRLPDFTLIDCTGKTVTRSDLLGQVVVFNFVFTSCSLKCRAVNERMAQIQQATMDLPGVQLVSFSIDPRTDSPKFLATFADGFGANPRRWRFLTLHPTNHFVPTSSQWIENVHEWIPLVPEGSLGTERILVADAAGVVRDSLDGLRNDVVRAVVDRIHRLQNASASEPLASKDSIVHALTNPPVNPGAVPFQPPRPGSPRTP